MVILPRGVLPREERSRNALLDIARRRFHTDRVRFFPEPEQKSAQTQPPDLAVERLRTAPPSDLAASQLYGAPVPRYVIDAPTLLHVVATDIEVSSTNHLVAPSLIRSQAMSLLLTAVQYGDITDSVAMQRHERFTEIKIRLLNDRVSRRTAWKLARERGWGDTFDAEYLAVCKLQADALVTIDPALAAKADGIVPVAPLGALSVG